MFPGRTNNDMLRQMMAVKTRPPNKVIRAHIRAYEVLGLEPMFEGDLRFRQHDLDPVTGKPLLRLVDIGNPATDLASTILSAKVLTLRLLQLMYACANVCARIVGWSRRQKAGGSSRRSSRQGPIPRPSEARLGCRGSKAPVVFDCSMRRGILSCMHDVRFFCKCGHFITLISLLELLFL